MPWPSDQDYNEAIQNPATAFSDHELKSGRIELNAMGLPKARSGNFATVYRVETASGPQAIRCFRYDNPEISNRYPAIAQYLSQNPLPYMVSFRFMSQGLRVGPNWYPTVKMKWVEGESLVSYIEKNLSSPSALQTLAADWVQMLTDLQRAKIAHGDLQHGNVLVVQGKLRLVDYDGMYVPSLEGSRGLELGHRNYQHPQRTELDFGPHLDNFSAWLIYISLLAISVQPGLWAQLKAGDECLLFRRQDLDAPDQSPAFRMVRALPDTYIRNLADQIEQFLWLPPDQVPIITGDKSDLGARGLKSAFTTTGGSWINDYRRSFVEAGDEDDFPVIEAGDPTWIQDHVDQKPDMAYFRNSANLDRLITLAILITTSTLCAWLSSILPSISIAVWMTGIGAAAAMTAASMRIRYRREPLFKIIKNVKSDLTKAEKETAAAQKRFAEIKAKRLQRRQVYLADCAKLQRRLDLLPADEAKQLANIDGVLKTALQRIDERRRAAAAGEGTEKRKLLTDIEGEISRITRALSSLDDQERAQAGRLDADLGSKVRGIAAQLHQTSANRDAELATALKTYQDQIVNSHLHRIKIADASIPGIGPQLKQRLAVAGYTSAGDIGSRHARVPGIGAAKEAALIAWRNQLEAPIRLREAPKSLPLHQVGNIQQRYEPQIRQLQHSLDQEQARLATEKDNLKTRFLLQRRLLESQKTTLENDLRQKTLAIEKKFNDERKLISIDEQAARSQFQQASDTCRNQVRSAAGLLTEEFGQLKKGYSANLETLNKEVAIAAKIVGDLSWRKDQVARKHAAYAPLSFRSYALRIIGRS